MAQCASMVATLNNATNGCYCFVGDSNIAGVHLLSRVMVVYLDELVANRNHVLGSSCDSIPIVAVDRCRPAVDVGTRPDAPTLGAWRDEFYLFVQVYQCTRLYDCSRQLRSTIRQYLYELGELGWSTTWQVVVVVVAIVLKL